ncbi:ABC transporter substrate-binding protein [Frankia sp. R82]|uniref:ABC transporter substrate-binding protein n=1 Tax=Frankia sp. R82 TaxID=2950553 RepID=UPI0020440177|nr:ABC transporter substrate-binding protein [Frankia sp. R82]MCM3882316.1 ABC transporter substrate-binding protein [Frankia sp. R82]
MPATHQRRNPFAAVLAALVAALIALVTLTACGSDSDGDSATPTAAATSATPTTHEVVDMGGRHVTVPTHPNRIVTNYPAVTQIIFMLGGIERVVGVPLSNLTTLPLFKKIYPPLAQKKAVFGADTTTVNTETLLAQKPDLVVLTSGNQALVKKITDLGVPVVQIASFPDYKKLDDGVTFLADVLGGDAPKRAQQYVEYVDGNVATINKGLASLPSTDRPKLYYTANSPLNTEGGGSIIDNWSTLAGGVNVATAHGVTGTMKDVSAESIVQWDPEYVFCRDASSCRAIEADPRWSSVSAVRNKHLIVNPRGVFVWAARSAEEALQPIFVAKTLHPAQFTDVSVEQEIKEFYQTFYSYKLTDAEVTGILHPTQP